MLRIRFGFGEVPERASGAPTPAPVGGGADDRRAVAAAVGGDRGAFPAPSLNDRSRARISRTTAAVRSAYAIQSARSRASTKCPSAASRSTSKPIPDTISRPGVRPST